MTPYNQSEYLPKFAKKSEKIYNYVYQVPLRETGKKPTTKKPTVGILVYGILTYEFVGNLFLMGTLVGILVEVKIDQKYEN